MKYKIALVSLSIVLWFVACKQTPDSNISTKQTVQVVEGETMGTYYRVSYVGDAQPHLKMTLDSVLVALNNEVSTYIPTSTISQFNQTQKAIDLSNAPHFKANLEKAIVISHETQGTFDPTVMPLVNYWGFGYTPKRKVTQVDSSAIDSLKQLVGMDKLSYTNGVLHKIQKGTQLDFSAIAKGYGVDLLADVLASEGIVHYLVDIGGEVVAKGYKGDDSRPWRIGIATPSEEAAMNDYQVAVPLRDVAIATSGNYRNFYEVEGQKFSHTINPRTGYPERSVLLSTSVMAANCATADAYATASMVAGLDSAFVLINKLPGVEAYFIYSDEQGEMQTRATAGFVKILEN